MAFIDYDSIGDPFINVTHRVDGTGDWDDLLVVQLMLDFVYSMVPALRKSKPTKGPITTSGKPATDTSILIKHFQKVQMKRVKPDGIVDRADGKRKENSTIYQLNTLMSIILVALESPDTVISNLTRKEPLLGPFLQTPAERKAARHKEYSL